MKLTRYLIAALTFVLCIQTVQPSPRTDSVLSLRYNLEPGRTYSWRLVADQFVVNDRSVRLSAVFTLDALDADQAGNSQVRVRIKASESNQVASAILDSIKLGLYPVGNRRTNKAGVYDAVIDELGKIITGHYGVDETVPPPPMQSVGTTTQMKESRDVDMPTIMGMMLPQMPIDNDVSVRVVRFDTILVPSNSQRMHATRGTIASEGSKQSFDTMYRQIMIDSIGLVTGGREIGFITITTNRHNANGTQSNVYATITRDTQTGLLERVIERGFSIVDGDEIPRYVAVALLDTNLNKLRDDEGNTVLTPPSLAPPNRR